MKNAALGGAGKEPKEGDGLQVVGGVGISAGTAGDGLDNAMKEAFGSVGIDGVKDDADADGLPDEFGEIDDLIVRGEAFDAKAEELGNALHAIDGADEQFILADGGG